MDHFLEDSSNDTNARGYVDLSFSFTKYYF